MKKITLFFALVSFAIASSQTVMLTQSVDPVTVDTGGVACWSSASGEYRSNSFWRSYNLADFGVTGDFEISEVQWGQGSADANNVLNLSIYIVDDEDLFSANDFQLLGSVMHNSSPSDDMTLVTASMSVVVPAGSIIAFEVNSPDGGTATDVRFFPGFNGAGELKSSYLQSTACGLDFPTPPATIGFPTNQYVMNVIGEEIPLSVSDNALQNISIFPIPAVDVLSINAPASLDINEVTLFDLQGRNTGAVYLNGTVDVSNLSRGVYMLAVKTSEGTLTQKIIKK